jgi:hypothetical protein
LERELYKIELGIDLPNIVLAEGLDVFRLRAIATNVG